MRSHAELFVHLVWGTWDRIPYLVAEVRPSMYRCITEQARRLDAEVIAIGGIEDHVHVLARFAGRISIADLVKQMKGGSSRHATADLGIGTPFRWQGSYGAFTVSRRGLDPVAAYIGNQESHHRNRTLIPALERIRAR